MRPPGPEDGLPAPPEPPAGGPGVQEVVTLLLHAAVQTAYAIDRLQRLAEQNAGADPAALGQVGDAITVLTEVRATLIRDADRLGNATSPPG